jgi:hypothetical protein
MSTLHAQLNQLARDFASSVLEAVQSASLQDLLAQATRTNGRTGLRSTTTPTVAAPSTARSKEGRLKRRTPEDIAKSLGHVVMVVKRHKNGLRAEQIRQQLGLESKEMPRLLKEGLAKRMLTSKGQKRATTYFAK